MVTRTQGTEAGPVTATDEAWRDLVVGLTFGDLEPRAIVDMFRPAIIAIVRAQRDAELRALILELEWPWDEMQKPSYVHGWRIAVQRIVDAISRADTPSRTDRETLEGWE